MTNLVHVSTTGKQNYGTPQLFVDYVARRFGLDFVLDLAADEYNKKAPGYINEEDNSLSVSWKIWIQKNAEVFGVLANREPAGWLNPPFKQNPKFALKAHQEKDAGTRFATLTLSSLGSNWFRDHFRNNALNLILEERMIFVGEKDPYPKELMLSLWGIGLTGQGWFSFKKEIDIEEKGFGLVSACA